MSPQKKHALKRFIWFTLYEIPNIVAVVLFTALLGVLCLPFWARAKLTRFYSWLSREDKLMLIGDKPEDHVDG